MEGPLVMWAKPRVSTASPIPLRISRLASSLDHVERERHNGIRAFRGPPQHERVAGLKHRVENEPLKLIEILRERDVAEL
ncbi:hypothetical protein ACVIU7_005243 [Bradyrhizobium liaoningense]|nr:hypothetical protein GCM10007858_55580 [Bradyrhizobium liaoningense]